VILRSYRWSWPVSALSGLFGPIVLVVIGSTPFIVVYVRPQPIESRSSLVLTFVPMRKGPGELSWMTLSTLSLSGGHPQGFLEVSLLLVWVGYSFEFLG
jgi:hypothetical protein